MQLWVLGYPFRDPSWIPIPRLEPLLSFSPVSTNHGIGLNNLVLVAELTQKRLGRQLRERTKEGEAAVARCDALAVALASVQVKFDANYIECNGLNATNKRLERQLRLRKKDAEDAEAAGVELQTTLMIWQGVTKWQI